MNTPAATGPDMDGLLAGEERRRLAKLAGDKLLKSVRGSFVSNSCLLWK
jgi:hypothetical protein